MLIGKAVLLGIAGRSLLAADSLPSESGHRATRRLRSVPSDRTWPWKYPLRHTGRLARESVVSWVRALALEGTLTWHRAWCGKRGMRHWTLAGVLAGARVAALAVERTACLSLTRERAMRLLRARAR